MTSSGTDTARRAAVWLLAMALALAWLAAGCSSSDAGSPPDSASAATALAAPVPSSTPAPDADSQSDTQGDALADDSGGGTPAPGDAGGAGSEASPGSGDGSAGESADPAAGDPTAAAEPSARLVVQDRDNMLFTVASDGTDYIALTDADGTINQQPTWSPDGSHIAWTNVDPSTGESFIKADRYDRTDPMAKDVPTPPFYLNWDGSSSQLAYLAPSAGGIDLGLVEMSDEGRAKRVDRGEPFYFSWGPLGDELLVHASEFRLDRIDVADGRVKIISDTPGTFQAPVWLGPLNALVFGERVDDANFLVVSGALGENPRNIATYDGYLMLTVSPDGTRIAFQTLGRDAQQGIVTAGAERGSPDWFQGDGPLSPSGLLPISGAAESDAAQTLPTQDPDDPFADPVDEILLNTLNVMGLFGGEVYIVSFEPSAGFFWSPDNETLAYLTPGSTTGSLRWWFWRFASPEGPAPGPEFIPSDVMVQSYYPFFDQYEQSVEFWSPESDRIVYAGVDAASGRSGIWTVAPEANAQPQFVVDGEFAAWSPTAAGGGASVL